MSVPAACERVSRTHRKRRLHPSDSGRVELGGHVANEQNLTGGQAEVAGDLFVTAGVAFGTRGCVVMAVE